MMREVVALKEQLGTMGDRGELWETKGTGRSCGIVGTVHYGRETT